MADRLELPVFRRLLAAAQGLARPLDWSVVDSVGQAGLVRTLGGVDVYLAARARVPSMTRADLDAAVAAGELALVPAVRGCIYLVPRRELPWASRLADLLSRRRAAREREKAGVRAGELAEVGGEVAKALTAQGPLTVNALRRALPDGTVRSLGEAGKKVGISSTLPPALRQLELTGAIERRPASGRIVGFWEYDPDEAEVVTGCFIPLADPEKEAMAVEAAALADFIRDDLGHGRSFSLDTDDALRRRVGQIRDLV